MEAVAEATAKTRKIQGNPRPATAKPIVRTRKKTDPIALTRTSVRGRSPRPNAPSHKRNLRIAHQYGVRTGPGVAHYVGSYQVASEPLIHTPLCAELQRSHF